MIHVGVRLGVCSLLWRTVARTDTSTTMSNAMRDDNSLANCQPFWETPWFIHLAKTDDDPQEMGSSGNPMCVQYPI